MLSGRIAGTGPDLVRKNRPGLAALLLLAVLAFGAWQWQRSPNGLLPTTGSALSGQPHDETAGLPEDGIPAGTPWAHVPESWRCPHCNIGKQDFVPMER